MTAQDGYLLIWDCARRNLYGDLHIKNVIVPIIPGQKPSPTIEWEKHQQPEVWAKLFLESGFRDPKITWRSDSRLLHLGLWQRNRIIAYLGRSLFHIMIRPA